MYVYAIPIRRLYELYSVYIYLYVYVCVYLHERAHVEIYIHISMYISIQHWQTTIPLKEIVSNTAPEGISTYISGSCTAAQRRCCEFCNFATV